MINQGVFGRIPLFDERSRQYPVKAAIREFAAKKPRSYTWRCTKTLDQGAEGSCTGFAWAHELIARPAEVLTVTSAKAQEIYFNAQRLDPWEGGAYSGATPFYEGSSVLAGAKATMITGLIGGYKWAFGIEDLKLGIGYYGPAVLGINWYDGMLEPDAQGFIHKRGSIVGGHAILCRAYDANWDYFTLRNSWGRRWGRDGDCYISGSDLRALLVEEGEAVFAERRRSA